LPAKRPHLLPARPQVDEAILRRLRDDHDRFAADGLPVPIEPYLREVYGLDVSGCYASLPLKNPWGKASGQLSMRLSQVDEAAEAGLGFVVLKTVIARDAQGGQSMAAWAVKESRMVVERVVGRDSGATGWTVTWKGRGWWQSFDDYLELVRDGLRIGLRSGMVVAPSVKYHLPGPGEGGWRTEEYAETTPLIRSAFESGGGSGPMPLEKDFSPTLAGSERSRQRSMILDWLTEVPALIRGSLPPGAVRVGLKLFNSLDDDDFQLAMLAHVHKADRPDFLVYANRLFDPGRSFEGHLGVAYGGPDLSDRNLRLLSSLRGGQRRGDLPGPAIETSATGDIHSGRMAIEYALRGCRSFQIHTLFQLPAEEFAMKRGGKLERALHRLYFDPAEGFVVWAHHAANRLGLNGSPVVKFLDIARTGEGSELLPVDLDAEGPEAAEE
jgi:dihydroorotate dehydrogenase